MARVDDWLGEPAPPRRLAVVRVLVMGFATAYLSVRLPAYLWVGDLPADRFDPVGILAWMDGPLAEGIWQAVVGGSLLLGILATAGAGFRSTGPLFAGSLLLVTTYRSSWGQLLWFEALMVIHVLIVGLARSADALAVDARRSGGRVASVAYGFPVRLAAVVTVLTYVLAGIAKLRTGGIDWVDGETLRNHVAYSAARLDVLGGTPSPLAGPFMRATWAAGPLALAALLIELAAPVALLGGRARTAWVIGAWGMHLAIAGLMLVVFPYPLVLVAFAPLFPVERLVPSRHRRPAGADRDGPAPSP